MNDIIGACFTAVVNMSITGCYVIAAVLLLRLALCRAPHWLSYSLWSVVFFRLFSPVSFSSSISLPGLSKVSSPQSVSTLNRLEYIPSAATQALSHNNAASYPINAGSTLTTAQPAAGLDTVQLWEAAGTVWLAGMAVLLIWAIASYAALHRRISSAVLIRDNIYCTDMVSTPFVSGLIKPKIYLPIGTSADPSSYILRHEHTHISRLDYLIKPIAFLAVILHWFNPLAWLAFGLMNKDMEMSCDERVLAELGGSVKTEYSQSLLALAASRSLLPGGPLGFGECNTKERVINVIRYKKSPRWAVAIAAILCVAMIAACAANPGGSGTSSQAFASDSGSKTTGDAAKFYFNYMQPNSIVIYDENGDRTIVQGGELSSEDIAGREDIAALGLIGSTEDMLVVPNTKVDYGPRGDIMNIYYKLPGNDYYQLDPTPDASGASSSGSHTGGASKYYFNFMQPNSIVIYDENCERTIVQGGELSADEISGRADIAAMGLVGSTEEMLIAPNTKVDYGPRGDFMNIYYKVDGNDFYQLDPTPAVSWDMTDLDQAITYVLMSRVSIYKDGECAAEGHSIYDTAVKGDTTEVYIQEMTGWFGFENDIFTMVSGGSNPAKIVFDKGADGRYVYRSYEAPVDGSDYDESLKALFTDKAYKAASRQNGTQYLYPQLEAYAQAYLDSIGRKAEISVDYVQRELPSMNVDASNTLLSQMSDWPYWIGTLEKIENDVRYVYEKQWEPSGSNGDGVVTYYRYVYGSSERETRQFVIKDGVMSEVIGTSPK